MTQEHPLKKANFTALLWSIVQPGLGHLYLGNRIIAFAFIFVNYTVISKTGLNKIIFYAFSGNFKKANALFAESPTLFFPSIYSFAMWHAYNYDIIARKGSHREYKLTGFFIGLTIGGVPGSSQKFLGSYIITGLAAGVVTGILFHLIEKLILYITKNRG